MTQPLDQADWITIRMRRDGTVTHVGIKQACEDILTNAFMAALIDYTTSSSHRLDYRELACRVRTSTIKHAIEHADIYRKDAINSDEWPPDGPVAKEPVAYCGHLDTVENDEKA